jgi:hypothetical protein
MRNIIKGVWEKTKWLIFLIVWTAGIIGYCNIWFVGIPMWMEIRGQADQTWTRHLERERLKKYGSGARVEENQNAESESQSLVPSREEKPSEKIVDTGRESAPPGEIEKKIRKTFKECPDLAVAVARAENTGMIPDQIGDRHLTFTQDGITYGFSVGIFQIRYLPGRPDPKELKDPDFNIKYAYEMYKASGWFPWSAWKNGSYQKYL